MIDQKTKLLQGSSPLVDQLLTLIERMLADRAERISIEDLEPEVIKLKSYLSSPPKTEEEVFMQVPQRDVYKI